MMTDKEELRMLRTKVDSLSSVDDYDDDEEFLKRKMLEYEAIPEWEKESRRDQREQLRQRSMYLSKHCRK